MSADAARSEAHRWMSVPAGRTGRAVPQLRQPNASDVAAVDDHGFPSCEGQALSATVIGSPAIRQPGRPPSSGRAGNPCARSSRTASGVNTQ